MNSKEKGIISHEETWIKKAISEILWYNCEMLAPFADDLKQIGTVAAAESNGFQRTEETASKNLSHRGWQLRMWLRIMISFSQCHLNQYQQYQNDNVQS